jgi:hypothetical protein
MEAPKVRSGPLILWNFAPVNLNLPPFEPRLEKRDGTVRIFDVVRKKYVVLTPEEWVRQHMVHYLLGHLGIPLGSVAVERGLDLNGTTRRFDVLAYKGGQPWALIECKAPEVPINQEVLFQAWSYHQVIPAPLVVLTNGMQHLIGLVQGNQLTLVQQFPSYTAWP